MSEPPLGVAVPDTRLHPIYLIIGTAKTLRQAIPFLVVTIFGGAPWWVNGVLFALVMMVAIAQWHVKKYSVVGGVLLLRSGLVNQSVRVVPDHQDHRAGGVPVPDPAPGRRLGVEGAVAGRPERLRRDPRVLVGPSA